MIGDLVKCISQKGWHGRGYGDETLPQVGTIYTIHDEGPQSIRLEEIVNEERIYASVQDGSLVFGEPTWGKENFVPVDTHQIDVFRALIQPLPKCEGVPA